MEGHILFAIEWSALESSREKRKATVSLNMKRWIMALLLSISFATAGTAQPDISLVVSEGHSVVFDHRRDRCDQGDIVDTPARAFRRPDGEIVMFASHHTARVFLGRSLLNLKRDCAVVFRSKGDPDPVNYNDRIWLASFWTNDGIDVLALGHQEYQAHRHQGRCAFAEYNKCWFNTINLMRSVDGGRSFGPAARVPLAAPASRSEDGQGRPRGFFEPSNIVRYNEYIYTLINTTGFIGQPSGVCLFRTGGSGKGSWEVMTAGGWTTAGQDPYGRVTMPFCVPRRPLHGPVHSLVRHETTGTFIAIMTIPGGPERGNLAFSLSSDLLEWTLPRVFMRTNTIFSGRCARNVDAYPSLIDESSPHPSMDTVGRSATLFLVRQRRGERECNGSINRDLIAFSVEIQSGI